MGGVFDRHSMEEIEDIFEVIGNMLDEGRHRKDIEENVRTDDFDELYDIAAARRRAGEKGLPSGLFMGIEDLRFATPLAVADYRAGRLKCGIIADLGCSVGMQAFSFAKTCRKVYAVEIDAKKLRYAQENARILGIKNIEFIQGDVLDPKIAGKISDAEILFCDPSRLAEEAERKIDTIRPEMKALLKMYKGDIAIEAPPQMREISLDCEKEYISVEGKLNRLTLYFRGLKKTGISVVALPSCKRIESGEAAREAKKTDKAMRYLYEADGAVVKAGITSLLAAKMGLMILSEDMLTSDDPIKSPFFRNSFRKIAEVKKDKASILKALQKKEVGKVVLRYKIDPSEYWEERAGYERKLKGSRTAHLFMMKKAVLAEKISS